MTSSGEPFDGCMLPILTQYWLAFWSRDQSQLQLIQTFQWHADLTAYHMIRMMAYMNYISSWVKILMPSMAQISLIYLMKKFDILTHWGQATHICVGKLTSITSDNGLSPGRRQAIIRKHCWNYVNWTLRNKLQWNFKLNPNIFIEENTFQNVVCEMSDILSRPQCVHSYQLGGGYNWMGIFGPIFLYNSPERNITWSAYEFITYTCSRLQMRNYCDIS